MKKTLLTTLNAKYIHINLALRWFYTTCPHKEDVTLKEFTIKDQYEHIVSIILEGNFDVVCFSMYIWNVDATLQIIKRLKELRKDIHIIVGGPEVTYESFDLLDQGVDAISLGEGEFSTWEYILMLDAKPHEIEGMYTKKFPNMTQRKTDLSILEQYPDPYFLDFDIASQANRYLYLETSRGCPYSCSYCLSSCEKSVRLFSIDYIMKILDKIANSNIRQVKLLDRTFNVDPKRALKIARYMNEHCKKQIFQFEVVAETLSEELLEFFVNEADVTRFRFEVGVQSFHAQTLQSVGRIQNNERLSYVIKRLTDAHCILHVDLIAGLPYENFTCFQNSFNSLFALGASELQLGILKLLKGTKLKKEAPLYGITYHKHAPYDVISTNWLNAEELHQLHLCGDAVEKFYNSGVARNFIHRILEYGWIDDAFTLFWKLGKAYEKLTHPYQTYQLFSCFYEVLPHIEKKTVDACMLMDYYRLFKQKPKRFTQQYISHDLRNKLLFFAFEHAIADQNILFRYGLVDIAYTNEGLTYQLILYNKQQTYPDRYILDIDHNQVIQL